VCVERHLNPLLTQGIEERERLARTQRQDLRPLETFELPHCPSVPLPAARDDEDRWFRRGQPATTMHTTNPLPTRIRFLTGFTSLCRSDSVQRPASSGKRSESAATLG